MPRVPHPIAAAVQVILNEILTPTSDDEDQTSPGSESPEQGDRHPMAEAVSPGSAERRSAALVR